jgi:glycosyltransferase involved in cell wall biosynthesis
MPPSPKTPGEALVQVVGPEDGWVLEKLARRLAAKLPYAVFVPWKPSREGGAALAYYVNYALYQGPSGLIDVAFFTHLDEAQQFLERARRVDCCVCMAKQYADWLRGQGVQSVTHIPMGFDAYRYRPRLVLGVVGRLEHPRKGKHLVDRLRALQFVEVVATEGKVAEAALWDLYQRVDYVLIPATVEGGPMSLLEGLAMGKPVIAPEGVGVVPEFGPTDSIRLYAAGDAEALVRVVTECYREKLRHAELVKDRTWDRWAEGHHDLFLRLLRERGHPGPEPAPGFRFGMLGELDIPSGVELDGLEAAVDGAAAHLYFGRYGPARAVLGEAVKRYPFAVKLLETIPRGDTADVRLSREVRPHLRALR